MNSFILLIIKKFQILSKIVCVLCIFSFSSCGSQTGNTSAVSGGTWSAALTTTNNNNLNVLSASNTTFNLICDGISNSSTPAPSNQTYNFTLPRDKSCVLYLISFKLTNTDENFTVTPQGQSAAISNTNIVTGSYTGSLGTTATITPSFVASIPQLSISGNIISFQYQAVSNSLTSSTTLTYSPAATSVQPYYTLMGTNKSLSALFTTTSTNWLGLSLTFSDSQLTASEKVCPQFLPSSSCSFILNLTTALPTYASSDNISFNNPGSYINNYSIASNNSNYAASNNTGATFNSTFNYFSSNSSTTNVSYPYVAVHPWHAFAGASANVCAIDNSGYLWCWGQDVVNQLTDGIAYATGAVKILNCYSASTALCNFNYLMNIRSVHVGASHICALLNTGYVTCWGNNPNGQTGQTAGATTYVPTLVPNLSNVLQLGGNQNAPCALVGSSVNSQSGTVYCWGNGSSGFIGNGTTTTSPYPSAVCGALTDGATSTSGCGGVYLNNIVALSNGEAGQMSCALKANGTVYCWGVSSGYQLGNNSTASTNIPVQVLRGTQTTCATYLCHIVSIYSGFQSTCAIDDTAQVYCWGMNNYGQLGQGNSTTYTTPVKVLSGATSATCGTYLCNVVNISVNYESACALLTTGYVYCWGVSIQGNLGNNTVSASISSVVQVLQQTGGSCAGGYLCNIVALTATDNATCALNNNGQIFCWGNNDGGNATNAGILGVKTTTLSSSPIPYQITGAIFIK